MFVRRFATILCGVFLVVAIAAFTDASLPGVAASETVSKSGLATQPPADAVDIALAREIALREAEKVWGHGVFRKPIIAYDLDGAQSAYIFEFKKGAGNFPTDDQVLKEISDAEAKLKAAKKALAVAREESFKEGRVKTVKEGGKVRIIRPAKWEEAEQNVRRLEKEKSGVGTYGTIIVSATRKFVPVLKGINGLHAYFMMRTKTDAEAKRALKQSSVRISKVYFGPPDDEMFEYEANGKKVLVGLSPVKAYPVGRIRKAARKAPSSAPEAVAARRSEEEWVRSKWEEIDRSLGESK